MNELESSKRVNGLGAFPARTRKICHGCGGPFMGGYTAIWCETCRENLKTARRAARYQRRERGGKVSKGRAVDPPMEDEWRCERFAELDRLIGEEESGK